MTYARTQWQFFLRGLVVAISVLPLLIVISFVAQKAHNVPQGDQWLASGVIALKTVDGNLRPQDLFAQHNEHRIFFTHVTTVFLTLTTQWNLKIESYSNIVLAVLNLGLLLALYREHRRQGLFLVLIPFSMLIFALRQRTNWLIGFQNCWHFAFLFTLIALWLAKHFPIGWRPLGGVAFCAICATFALGSGLLLWGLLPVTLWLLGYRRWQYFLFWGVVGGITLGLYFWGYCFIEREKVSDPLIILKFVLAYLGSPFVPYAGLENDPVSTSRQIGIFSLILLAINSIYLLVQHRHARDLAVWLTLMGSAFGGATLAAMNRAETLSPLTERFVTLAIVYWVAVVAILCMVLQDIWQTPQRAMGQRALLLGNGLVLIVLMGLHVRADKVTYDLPASTNAKNIACLVNYPQAHDATCLAGIHETIRGDGIILPWLAERIEHLAGHRLSIFADASNPLPKDYVHHDYVLLAHTYCHKCIQSANTAYAEGDYQTAIRDYSCVIDGTTFGLEYAYNRRGDTYTLVGDNASALADFNQVLSLQPNDLFALTKRGSVYLALGDTTNALADFSRVLTLDPHNLFALLKRGEIYDTQGRSDEALVDFSAALVQDPANLFALNKRANIYLMQGNTEQALADFNQVLASQPDDAFALNKRGDIYLTQQRYPEALADFSQVLAGTPDDLFALNKRGIVYMAQARYSEALADFQQVLIIDPANEFAKAKLVELRQLGYE